MKKLLFFILIIFCLQSVAQTKDSVMDHFIFDFEKDFNPSQVDSLQAILLAHYKITGDQIVVLSIENPGKDLTNYANHFGATQLFGDSNRINSMVIAISIKGKQFSLVPNKKMQVILTHDIMEELLKAGYPELKAHQFFAGVWKECKSFTDYLQKVEKKP